MELNVKQSGIEKRVFRTTFYKTRSGKFNKRVHELYLRNDLPCGLSACSHCHYEGQMKPILFEENAIVCKSAPFRHCLLIDGPTILRFIDECPEKSLAAIVIGISSNGIKVMVPKFGLESVIYLNRGGDGTIRQNVTWTQQRMAEFCASNGISLFKEVKVSVAVVEHKDQRKRIDLKLVDPVVDGLSIVMDCETNI
uniref:Rrp44_S1 domain-containing protein n=1 Tax=Globodera pallida TaxID=36090 RepID=A0A183BI10_GLOPA